MSFPCGRFKLTRVGFRAHVKIASRIVSYSAAAAAVAAAAAAGELLQTVQEEHGKTAPGQKLPPQVQQTVRELVQRFIMSTHI